MKLSLIRLHVNWDLNELREPAPWASQGKCFQAEGPVSVKGCEGTLVGGLLWICQVPGKLFQESLMSDEDWQSCKGVRTDSVFLAPGHIKGLMFCQLAMHSPPFIFHSHFQIYMVQTKWKQKKYIDITCTKWEASSKRDCANQNWAIIGDK